MKAKKSESIMPKNARRVGVSMTAKALWKEIRRTVSTTSQYLRRWRSVRAGRGFEVSVFNFENIFNCVKFPYEADSNLRYHLFKPIRHAPVLRLVPFEEELERTKLWVALLLQPQLRLFEFPLLWVSSRRRVQPVGDAVE